VPELDEVVGSNPAPGAVVDAHEWRRRLTRLVDGDDR
jgi:hypothetical protein